MNIKRLKEHLLVDLQTNVVPLIVGPTGVGKSDIVAQVAEDLNMTLIDLRMGECGEAVDIFGLPTTSKNGDGYPRTIWTLPTWYPTADIVELPHLLFLDEINRADSKDTLQTIFKLLLKKEIHERKLPRTWRVAAAMNPPNDDNYYVQEMDLALQTRFIKYDITSDPTIWLEWAYENKINQQILDYISVNTESLHNPNGRCNPRTWTMLSEQMNKMEELGKLSLLYEKAQGLLDATVAAKFMKFVEGNLLKPIPAKDILANYPKVKDRVLKYIKNNNLDVLYATLTELINIPIDPKVLPNLRLFILDLPVEMGYKLLRDFTEKEQYDSIFVQLAKDKDIRKIVEKVDY